MEQYIHQVVQSSNISEEEATTSLIDKMGDIPLGRPAEPEEIADLIKFLVSPDAKYITGAVYQIDGGSMAVV